MKDIYFHNVAPLNLPPKEAAEAMARYYAAVEAVILGTDEKVTKRRGRPKGSKNKPKVRG